MYGRLSYKGSTLASDLLHGLWESFRDFTLDDFRGKHRKQGNSFNKALYDLRQRGAVEIVEKRGQKFVQITKKGELEVLMQKSLLSHPKQWDGKWRMILFDIPESSRHLRNQLRRLLKQYGYKKLQASVFISPHPLNRAAVSFLEESGLMDYIRIVRVQEMDNDKDIRKLFNL
jgi:CRISPR-associated endonuclease Cas2